MPASVEKWLFASYLKHFTSIARAPHTTVRSVSLLPFISSSNSSFSRLSPIISMEKAHKSCPLLLPKKPHLRKKKLAGGKSDWPWKSFLISTDVSTFFFRLWREFSSRAEWNVLCRSDGLCDGKEENGDRLVVIFVVAPPPAVKNVWNCFFFSVATLAHSPLIEIFHHVKDENCFLWFNFFFCVFFLLLCSFLHRKRLFFFVCSEGFIKSVNGWKGFCCICLNYRFISSFAIYLSMETFRYLFRKCLV